MQAPARNALLAAQRELERHRLDAALVQWYFAPFLFRVPLKFFCGVLFEDLCRL